VSGAVAITILLTIYLAERDCKFLRNCFFPYSDSTSEFPPNVSLSSLARLIQIKNEAKQLISDRIFTQRFLSLNIFAQTFCRKKKELS